MTSSAIIVLNKTDLRLRRSFVPLPGATVVAVSALTGTGIEAAGRNCHLGRQGGSRPQDMVAINARHANALATSREWLAAAEY